ncbi:uncharacterized protein RAG0_00353 [Rhynchosporium agropyri]|uniref:HOOK N-terminal domain-containing protein n=1 Tax=Rhynchosporium agropyri TaxID=914238 RepID=A0A1E1JSD7_9HELO|nr:uncharacterized protein RAG0_00353 [Rhynchosporium agropyri]
MPLSRATELALLEWTNTFPLDSAVDSVPNLTDGVVFAKMLEDIDPSYAVRHLEKDAGTSKWLGKKKNLEAIHRSLLRYINNTCEGLDSFILDNPVDLNAIAQHEDVGETLKLLTLFLMAAIKGADLQKYVSKITTTLNASSQGEIAGIIKKADAEESTRIATGKTGASVIATNDAELELEEKYAHIAIEHDTLKKKHADFISRFERLQQSHDELLDYSNKQDTKLKGYENSDDGDQADHIRSLNSRIQEQEDLIASQESQVESDRIARERLSKELSVLRPSSQRLVEVEDELKELKTANIALSRKANTVDHYQKKVEHMALVEKENTALREMIDTLQGNQKDFDRVYDENTKIKATLKEYQQRFHSYELTYVELSTQKKHIEEQLRLRDDQLQVLTARQQHDEKFIDQLQEQIKTGNLAETPDSPIRKQGGLNLEEELEQSEDPTPNLLLEVSRLKAENQALKSYSTGTTNATLHIDLEEAERVKKRLQENLRDLTEKHTLAQQQLSAIISESADEKEATILRTRKLYLEANQELSNTKCKLAELSTDLSGRDRDLISTKTDLAAVNQEEIDAVNNLKAAHELISSSLENDLLALQRKHRDLSSDFDEQKTQLVDALLSKDRLMQDLGAAKEGFGAADDGEAQARAILEAEDKLREQLHTQDALIEDLQMKLKVAEANSPEAQKAANDAMIKNLIRENTLMATAWYDLTSRLQSNHVVLQRRQDAPKSWLNKQRQMMVNTPSRRQ